MYKIRQLENKYRGQVKQTYLLFNLETKFGTYLLILYIQINRVNIHISTLRNFETSVSKSVKMETKERNVLSQQSITKNMYKLVFHFLLKNELIARN